MSEETWKFGPKKVDVSQGLRLRTNSGSAELWCWFYEHAKNEKEKKSLTYVYNGTFKAKKSLIYSILRTTCIQLLKYSPRKNRPTYVSVQNVILLTF